MMCKYQPTCCRQRVSSLSSFTYLFLRNDEHKEEKIGGGKRESGTRQGAKGRRRRDDELRAALSSVASGGCSEKQDCLFSMQRTAGGLEATHCGPIALIGILVCSAEAEEHVIRETTVRARVCA